MVRRAAAGKLGEFAKVAEIEYLRSDLIPLFTTLAADEQVSDHMFVIDARCYLLDLIITSFINCKYISYVSCYDKEMCIYN